MLFDVVCCVHPIFPTRTNTGTMSVVNFTIRAETSLATEYCNPILLSSFIFPFLFCELRLRNSKQKKKMNASPVFFESPRICWVMSSPPIFETVFRVVVLALLAFIFPTLSLTRISIECQRAICNVSDIARNIWCIFVLFYFKWLNYKES